MKYTLQDCISASRKFIGPCPSRFQQWIVRSPMVSEPGHCRTVDGVMMPASSAAAATISFTIDPGW